MRTERRWNEEIGLPSEFDGNLAGERSTSSCILSKPLKSESMFCAGTSCSLRITLTTVFMELIFSPSPVGHSISNECCGPLGLLAFLNPICERVDKHSEPQSCTCRNAPSEALQLKVTSWGCGNAPGFRAAVCRPFQDGATDKIVKRQIGNVVGEPGLEPGTLSLEG